MANTHSEVPPVLTCWKDIAQYLGKGVRTVQRWEQELGLPVRRPNGSEHKSPVAAHPGDLDAWIQSRWSARNGGNGHRKRTPANGADLDRQLSEGIRKAQELSRAHAELMTQTSMAIQALCKSCSELNIKRNNRSPN